MIVNRSTYYNICNPNTPELPGCKNIYSQKDLDKLKEEVDAIFLLNIHLNWDERKLSSDYGFEIANYIRTSKHSLSPIIFYSYIQKEYFEYKSKTLLKYKILFGRGSAFLEAPFTITELFEVVENVPHLSQSSLHDVVTMLTDVKGIVLDKLNHDLKFGDDPLPHFNEVEPYLTEKQKALVSFEDYRQKLVKFNIEDKKSLFYDSKEAFLSLCSATLTEKGQSSVELPLQKHKILLIEDVETELENAVNHLENTFSIVSVRDGQAAIEILKADTSNEILAVISDWRLYKNGSQYWQKYQGYEVLEEAFKTGFRALFALTSQADFVVHHIRNTLGFKFFLLKKQNLKTPEQWSLFSDLIQAGCTDVISTFSEMPSSASWVKDVNGISYKELYFQKRQSLDSTDFFASVSGKANEVWDYLMEEVKTGFKDVRQIKLLFGLEVPKKKLNLFTILVLRLIWMGLRYKLETEPIKNDKHPYEEKLIAKVYMIICTGYHGAPTDTDINVELNKLCLTNRDIQKKILLPHEKKWLLQHKLPG